MTAPGTEPASEVSRLVAVDRLPATSMVEATQEECAALAERLHIPAVHSLVCRFTLKRRGALVEADGALEATVEQSCVVSLLPVEQRVSERFRVRFVPADRYAEDDTVDSIDAPDEIPYAGATIDLGEAAAEQLALALDPYPRRPDAELDPAATDGEGSAFGALAAFRPKQAG